MEVSAELKNHVFVMSQSEAPPLLTSTERTTELYYVLWTLEERRLGPPLKCYHKLHSQKVL